MPAEFDDDRRPHTTELLDTTLRDGAYAVDFQFDEGFVIEVLERLDDTPVNLIEVGHGLGFEAERSGSRACNIGLGRWCELAGQHLEASSWGMFAQPEFSRLGTLAALAEDGMSFVRVGMEPHRVPENLGYLERALELCDRVYLNLMKTSDVPSIALPGLLRDVPQEIAGLYIVDSYGTMLPHRVDQYVQVAADLFPVVGFHGHDNLGMANANSLAAVQAGASLVDGTLNGIGRGAGNAELESLAGILTLLGADGYDYQELAALAKSCQTALRPVPNDRHLEVLGGVIGVHTGHFPLVLQLCSELGLTAARVMEQAVAMSTHGPGRPEITAAAQQLAGASRPSLVTL
ncbi:MAG TPA: hypothetical protein VI248_16750 [Kineosporiaceae bacterium]